MPSDRDLVDQALDGDAGAARAIVMRHRFVVTGALRRFRALTPEDAEDLFQETFARLFENECAALRRWYGADNLADYLRSIARNLALDHIRAHRSGPEREVLEDPDELVGDAEDPQTLALINELRRMLLDAVQRLAPPNEEVIRLVDLLGLSYEEAAEQLGITRNHLGVRLHNARAALARVITAHYPALRAHLTDSA